MLIVKRTRSCVTLAEAAAPAGQADCPLLQVRLGRIIASVELVVGVVQRDPRLRIRVVARVDHGLLVVVRVDVLHVRAVGRRRQSHQTGDSHRRNAHHLLHYLLLLNVNIFSTAVSISQIGRLVGRRDVIGHCNAGNYDACFRCWEIRRLGVSEKNVIEILQAS